MMSLTTQKKPATCIPFCVSLNKVEFKDIQSALQIVEKPGRYVGAEYGIPKRDVNDSDTIKNRALLIYPDTYELGMSNQGLKILYDRLNSLDDCLADRYFIPMQDFADALMQNKVSNYSLDHFLDIRSFDFWAINTATELTFTNILYCLDLAGIPLEREKRRFDDPIIISGGTAISNPFPLFSILDAIFMGDGEEAIVEIHQIIRDCKHNNMEREAILVELANNVEGLFVPQQYTITNPNNGSYPKYVGPAIKKRDYQTAIFAALDHLVVPNIEIVQSRVVIEVARGCGQGCRFCHAGFWKRPVRNSAVAQLVKSAGAMLKHTGENSISLHSLSIADYPYLEELVVDLSNAYGQQGVSLSLPSLRVQVKTIPVLEMTSGIRRSNITFALEAGSELMREKIRKKTSEENLHYLINLVFSKGWDLVKVYLMMGLPDSQGTETNDLARVLNDLGQLAQNAGNRKKINVTVSLYVPKPFTTFQWEKQADPDYFLNGLRQIKSELKSRRVSIKGPSPFMPYIEGLLSRSDHRMGEWLIKAYKKGAKMDSWDDKFNRSAWDLILKEIPQNLKKLWIGEKKPGSILPWNELILPKGAKTEILARDYIKFQNINSQNMNPAQKQIYNKSEFPQELLKPVLIDKKRFETKYILQLEYEKKNQAIYISHLETSESLRRACRRIELPMTFSNGFNKHEKFHFLESLPLYFHSECEVIYIELFSQVDLQKTKNLLNTRLQTGIRIKELSWLDSIPKHKQINERSRKYRLDFQNKELSSFVFDQLNAAPEVFTFQKIERKKKRLKKMSFAKKGMKEVSRGLGISLSEINKQDNSLSFLLGSPALGSISVSDLLVHYLQIPASRWNVDVLITRLSM